MTKQISGFKRLRNGSKVPQTSILVSCRFTLPRSFVIPRAAKIESFNRTP